MYIYISTYIYVYTYIHIHMHILALGRRSCSTSSAWHPTSAPRICEYI